MKAKPKSSVVSHLRREQIAARARELWEENGRQPGRELDYWLQAECEVQSACLPASAAKAAKLMILKENSLRRKEAGAERGFWKHRKPGRHYSEGWGDAGEGFRRHLCE